MKKIILLILNFCCFFASCQRTEPEVFIIPKGFKGKVMVVFEKKNGVLPKLEKNRRVYEIPNNGILVTQSMITEGFMSRQFYYIDSLNQRIPLKSFKNEKEAESYDEIGIFYSGRAGIYGNSGGLQSIIYQEFIVSDYKNLNSFFTEDYKKQFHKKLEQAVGYEIK